MTQIDKYAVFAALHVPGDPLILYNIWDADSAKAVAEAGAKAIAAGSARSRPRRASPTRRGADRASPCQCGADR